MDSNDTVIGLIPAAGLGSRLGRLPCSKELLPVRMPDTDAGSGRGMTAIDNAVGALVASDITCQYVILRPGKWDIPAYLGDGSRLGAALSYLVAESSQSVPESLNIAYPYVRSYDVVLVFPDILFTPRGAISDVVERRRAETADVMIALVPTTRGDKVDLVSRDESGRVLRIMPKPGAGRHGWTWVTASWTPRFSEFLDAFVRAGDRAALAGREAYVGDVLNAAIDAGFVVRSLEYAEGDAIDIGTPEDLQRAWVAGLPGN
jgi:glucose-1-phosphate thymidylyltransferase